MSDSAEKDAAYREQAEALIADLRARLSHYEALLVAVHEETLTQAAAAVDRLFLRVEGFGAPWDRGYAQAVKDVRELRVTPPGSTEGEVRDE